MHTAVWWVTARHRCLTRQSGEAFDFSLGHVHISTYVSCLPFGSWINRPSVYIPTVFEEYALSSSRLKGALNSIVIVKVAYQLQRTTDGQIGRCSHRHCKCTYVFPCVGFSSGGSSSGRGLTTSAQNVSIVGRMRPSSSFKVNQAPNSRPGGSRMTADDSVADVRFSAWFKGP